jgi:hypothetical protein
MVERLELPGVLGDIARIATVEAAVAIAKTFGGTRLYLPHEPRAGHALSELVGVKIARLLCRQLGGRRHDIPSARPALRWHEARRLRLEEQLSHAAIALRLGITIGHARNLVEGLEFTAGSTKPARPIIVSAHCPLCGKRRSRHLPHAVDPRQLQLPLGQ